MAYVTTEESVERLKALFGQFMTEMAVLNRKRTSVWPGKKAGRDTLDHPSKTKLDRQCRPHRDNPNARP